MVKKIRGRKSGHAMAGPAGPPTTTLIKDGYTEQNGYEAVLTISRQRSVISRPGCASEIERRLKTYKVDATHARAREMRQ